MAHESLKNKIEESECQKCEGRSPCANNCGFYGTSVTNNLCSKCYRDLIMQKHQAILVSHPTTSVSSSTVIDFVSNETEKLIVDVVDNLDKKEPEEPSIIHRSNRCSVCQKRVGLTGFQCRCGSTFCSTHRYPETHECSFNFKNAGREAITKKNPVVKRDKIVKI